MLANIVKWSLRMGAWLCLLAAVGRLVAFPKQAWLTGRIFQTHVLFEAPSAERAFFNELGLDQHFDPDEYKMTPLASVRYFAPIRLDFSLRERDFGSGPDAHIWLEADGSYASPPLEVSYRNPDVTTAQVSFLRLQGRDAVPHLAAFGECGYSSVFSMKAAIATAFCPSASALLPNSSRTDLGIGTSQPNSRDARANSS